MLIGEYVHSIDAKKRLAVPSKLRKEFGERAVLTKGLDSCLFLYPVSEWQKVSEKMSSLPTGQAGARSLQRTMFGGASEVELDQLGRILVPDYLKEYAGLKQKVVLAGVQNRLEIWDEEKWRAYTKEAEKNADMIAEKLGELGMF